MGLHMLGQGAALVGKSVERVLGLLAVLPEVAEPYPLAFTSARICEDRNGFTFTPPERAFP